MSRIIRLMAAIAIALLAFESTLTAAGPTSVKPPKPTKPQMMKPATTTTAVKPVKPAKATAKPLTSTAKADAKAAKHSSSTGTSTTTPGTGTTTTVVSNPLADKIASHPNLAAKIQGKLPAGTTLAQASTGFKNQGQFIAAVNVSNNLGIDFTKLQAAMTGQTTKVDPVTHEIISTPTGVAPLSLGQSIQKLRPGVDADAATVKATDQTSVMLQTTTASTTSTKTKSKKSGH